MAWGREKQVPAPPSAVRQVLPLVITFVVLGALAWVCYQIYISFGKIQDQARKQMGDKVVFTKDGLRVNVKEVGTERYQDRTQSWVVKAWNLGRGSEEGEDAVKRKKQLLKKSRTQ